MAVAELELAATMVFALPGTEQSEVEIERMERDGEGAL
jgi:hypothetical protein